MRKLTWSRARGTDGSLLSSLPWTLAALGLALAPHLPYLPAWVSGTFLACAAWRLLIERRRGTLPAAWFRAILALGCFLGVLATYDTISGVGPGSALLAVMASLKLLETRQRRDQFVLLFIAIFLVMSSLLREQHLWSLPYLLAALVFIMTAWLRTSGNPAERIRTSLCVSGRLVAYAAPLALAMWFFFPRIATPFWAVPIDTSSGTTGLSDTMSPGDITSLSQSAEVAFRARFSGSVPEHRDRYWRATVLHRFNGRTWTGREPTIGFRPGEDITYAGQPLRYQLTMEPTRQHWVPALELPASWTLPETYLQPTLALARIMPIDQRISYEVVSYTRHRVEPRLRPFFRSWFLDLPDGTNPRTRALAQALHTETRTNDQYVDRVLSMFHEEEFIYTTEPPALGSDPVDRFLFDTRRGFCEHYASAFTVLMRAAGVPARVVLGYQGGELNPMGDYMIVRQSDAHAWSEVWLERRGWVRVDPTAAVAPERIELGRTESRLGGRSGGWAFDFPTRVLHQLQLSWDAMNAAWNDWVLGYGPDKQKGFMQWLGMENPKWRDMFLALIGIVIALTLAISAVMMWRYRPPPPDRARVLYGRFVRATGLDPGLGESPAAFAKRAQEDSAIAAETIDNVTILYQAARYGGRPELIDALAQEVAALGRRKEGKIRAQAAWRS